MAQNDTTIVHQLDDAVVTATRTATTAQNVAFTVSVVDRATLTSQQRINILPTLSEHVPGLFLTQRGMMGYGVSNGAAGGMTLRGLSSSSGQLLVLIDGHPQYQGIYGHSIADSYQTMMAERVEVLRGPASVLYGSNAMGGVINIITRASRDEGAHPYVHLGGGSYGTAQAEAGTTYRSGRFTANVAGQYARTDNHRPRMGFDQYGGNMGLGYRVNDHWNLFAHADVTHFDASYPGTTGAPMYEADQWITRGAVSLGADFDYANHRGRISVYDNFGRHKINDGYAEGGTPQKRFFRSSDALLGFSAYDQLRLWTGGSMTLGIDYQNIYGHAYYTNRETGEVMDAPNKQSAEKRMNEVAGYADFRQNLLSWCDLDVGVRYDYHDVAGGEWIPQFGVVTHPVEDGQFRATVSKGFRNPTLREMYLYPPSTEDLLPERIWNYELAWRHSLYGSGIVYGVNLFLLKGDNMIQTATVQLPDGTSKKQNVNTGAIANKGVEAEFEWTINRHWNVTTNHSYLYMEHHILAAPQYKGYLGANMHYGKWSANAGLQQVCGLFTAVGAADGNDPTSTFTLLNAGVSYRVLPWLTLWAKGDNLLGQFYEINAGYPMPGATFMGGVNIRF
ncbi:MAG: TonB-dependent receptor [Bacteroidales bacterium]|nr:TonB-dependent receptor [Bacteroidales bacterium]